MSLTDSNRIMHASTILSGTAAVWCYNIVQANQVPTTCFAFKDALVKEFIPDDHIRRSRDKLRKRSQSTLVSRYLADFRNLLLTILDTAGCENVISRVLA